MERVFPLRLYGDGADTIGLNSFELMSMMSVAPNRSSSLQSRFVLLQQQSELRKQFLFLVGSMPQKGISMLNPVVLNALQ